MSDLQQVARDAQMRLVGGHMYGRCLGDGCDSDSFHRPPFPSLTIPTCVVTLFQELQDAYDCKTSDNARRDCHSCSIAELNSLLHFVLLPLRDNFMVVLGLQEVAGQLGQHVQQNPHQ